MPIKTWLQPSFSQIAILVMLSFLFLNCEQVADDSKTPPSTEKMESLKINLELANDLAALPLQCMDQEYPNKLNQVLVDGDNLGEPHELHPAFYGCFDWHSAVHGHWMLVKLLKAFPGLTKKDSIRAKLKTNLSAENILAEVAYFQQKQSKSFERTYGWAWLLKLAEELHTWDDPQAKEWEQNLQPLSDLIVERYIDFLPKLLYPIRVGEHPNTGFGLSFAHDYAKAVGHIELQTLIEERAKFYFLNDNNCPLTWEPSGFDFLSPCLQEADIMRRVLPKAEFKVWFEQFLPQLCQTDYVYEPAKVSDRSDGKLVHLDGVNLSRAWCLYGLNKTLPEYNHFVKLGNEHLDFTLKNIAADDYAGGHWLASFAIYALTVE